VTWYREWFGEEYLDLYAYRDDKEAQQHVAFFREQVGSVRGKLLDLACGNGRHLVDLRQEGYQAIGCDLSYVLLRHGRAQNGAMPMVRADMRSLPFCSSTFHGLVNFFTSFGYFENEDDNSLVVREMCRVLRKGSPFLFDFMNVHRELRKLVEQESREVDGEQIQIERWFDPATRTINKRISIGDKRFLERVRGYDLDEISALFASGGLAIRRVFGDFDGSEYDHDSPRLIVIGVRRP
jgi:SAM-dependent methyltransferase